MYSDWASVQNEIQTEKGHKSVLSQYPSSVGRDVANSVVHSLAVSLARSSENGDPSMLNTEDQVQWTMQIICYGLSLPLSDIETIKDCVNIYCDWLSCLLPEPKKQSIPLPVAQATNDYAVLILHHLYNIFVPRLDGTADLVSKQALFCHRILRTIQACAEKSTITNSELWDCMLRFLLSVNDVLLAPPAEKDSIGMQLCERVLATLFDVWILSCARCFPAPSLWRTLQEMCSSWRHHEALVVHWHRVNFLFTSKLLRNLYNTELRLTVSPGEEEVSHVIDSMDNDRIVQCWFRFLHTLGNPVDLSRPHVIGGTQQLIHAALTSEVAMPYHLDCLKHLPTIFYRAMRSVATLVDAFLGIHHVMDSEWLPVVAAIKQHEHITQAATVTPPSHRRPRGPSILMPHRNTAKDAAPRPSVGSDMSAVSVASASSSATAELTAALLSPRRPTVNSLLHLFGSWLLEASLIGVRVHGSESKMPLRGRTASLHVVDADPARLQSQLEHSLTDSMAGGTGLGNSDSENYEAGRAQACGTLCRIFCSQKTFETILPVYTARFYIVLYYALYIDTESFNIPPVLASVIANSCDLLRVDIDGIHIIVPRLLHAIEELQPRFKYRQDDDDVELRHASIHLLLSMLCLPLWFVKTPIKPILNDTKIKSNVTFISLKKTLFDLLVQFLNVETDPVNTHMLLGGLVVCILDQALWEKDQKDESLVEHQNGNELFDKAVSLICNRLMVVWKGELNSALTALEVLSALARVHLNVPSHEMCKRAVNWICEFVVHQCSRPPPYHSKDLHSTIVAAYQCLTIWLLEHDSLLRDSDCLQTVLQVVELGITGSKSQSKPTDNPQLKGDKLQPRPVSKRVFDAAEALLTAIIDFVGCYPPPCGPESLCSLMDEESLLKLCTASVIPEKGSSFQYYVVDNSTIIALLDQKLGNPEEHLPTVTAVVRGAFGRHCWTMQLRNQPRSQKMPPAPVTSDIDTVLVEKVEPVKCLPRVQHQYFPDIVQQIPPVVADRSIPRLETTMNQYQSELEQLASLVASQVQFEQNALQNYAKVARPPIRCSQPKLCQEFQTARLFLSHYGFLNLEGLKSGSLNNMPPSLMQFTVDDPEELMRELKQLDALPVRTADTINVFYVKAGQTKLDEILQNVCHKQNVQPHFLEFLRSLGWPVDVLEHSGWTGSVATSWKTQAESTEEKLYPADTGGSLYDGQQQVLYWADVSSELVFVVPSPTSYALAAVDKALPHTMSTDASLGTVPANVAVSRHKSQSLDFVPNDATNSSMETVSVNSNTSGLRRSGRAVSSLTSADVQVMVVWLESFEDHLTFPSGDLLKPTSLTATVGQTAHRNSLRSQACVIFIHPLQSGLFRIRIQAQQTRISDAGPLVDGMVISRRLLGHMIRQTVVNIFKRRYLDTDPYQPPHVRRKLKIKDIVEKYQCRMSEPEFYLSLFNVNPGARRTSIASAV